MKGPPDTHELAQQHREHAQKDEDISSVAWLAAQFAECIAEDIATAMERLKDLPPSRERSLVQTKLDEAMMWLQRATPVTNEEEI